MKGSISSAFLLAGGVLAGPSINKQCPAPNTCFSLNIPDASATSSGDVYIQLTAPSSYSWVGVGTGSQMAGSTMLIAYASGDGNNVTISGRKGSGHSPPAYSPDIKLSLLDGSGVSNGVLTANIRCSSCGTSQAQWIWGAVQGNQIKSDSPNQSISKHTSLYGTFTFDTAQARGGSSANPFTAADSNTIQPNPSQNANSPCGTQSPGASSVQGNITPASGAPSPGTSGASGSSGSTGTTGASGALGSSGSSGSTGSTGSSGSSGSSGSDGTSGGSNGGSNGGSQPGTGPSGYRTPNGQAGGPPAIVGHGPPMWSGGPPPPWPGQGPPPWVNGGPPGAKGFADWYNQWQAPTLYNNQPTNNLQARQTQQQQTACPNGQSTPNNSDGSSGQNRNSVSSANGAMGITRYTKIQTTKLAHAVCAALAFLFFFPFGAIMIRLLSVRGIAWLHAFCQIIGQIVFTVAFALGVSLAKDFHLINSYHAIIGILLFTLLWIQPILGLIHHAAFKKAQTRTASSYGHLWIGRLSLTLGMINGGLGFLLSGRTGAGPKVYGFLAALIWLAYVAAIVIGERRRSKVTHARRAGPPREKAQPAMQGPYRS